MADDYEIPAGQYAPTGGDERETLPPGPVTDDATEARFGWDALRARAAHDVGPATPPSDVAVQKALVAEGHSPSEVLDPYGVRNGQGIDQFGPPNPTPEQLAAAQAPNVPAPIATPPTTPTAAPKGRQGPSRGTVTAGAESASDVAYVAPVESAGGDPYASTVQDPTVARYMAAQRDLQNRLQGAQGQAAGRREWEIANGALSGFGVQQSAGEQAAIHGWANAPVNDILDQEKAKMGQTEQAAKEQGFLSDAEAANPKSATSLAAQKLMGLPPGSIPAKLLPQALEHLKLKDEQKRRATESADKAKHETAETAREHERSQTQITIAGMKDRADRKEAAKNLSPEERKRMDEAFTGYDAIGELENEHAQTGPLSAAADLVGIPTDYSRAKMALAGPVGQLEYPGARGPSAAKYANQALPNAKTPNAMGARQFEKFKDLGVDRLEHYVQSQESAHPDSPEVHDARRKLEAIKADRARSTQSRVVRSPSGSRHPLAPGAAVPKGWTLE